MKLQQILASSSRQKIQLTLSKAKETHLSALIRMTNSTYNQVYHNLELFEREGIVDIKRYGRMKMIRLRHDNPKTKALLEAMFLLENVGHRVDRASTDI